jgi:hypothetical protein
MLFFHQRYLVEKSGYFFKSFLPSHFLSFTVKFSPFHIFTGGGCFQIGGGITNDAGGKRSGNGHLSTLQMLEKSLSMFFFIIGCFLKDGCNLLIALFFSLLGKESVPIAGL